MKTGAYLTSMVVLLALAVVPAATATDPTSKTAEQIREYRESGDWAKAVAKQAKKAKAWLEQRAQAKNAPKKPALVLDIDETSLDNYPCFDKEGVIPYDSGINAGCVVAYDAPPIKPVLSLFKRAKQLKVKVFFITGRPEPIRAGTLKNLRAAGYTGKYELILEPEGYDKDSWFRTRAAPASRSRSAASRSSPTSATSRAICRAGIRSEATSCRT